MNRNMIVAILGELGRKGRDIIYFCCVKLKDCWIYCFLKGKRSLNRFWWWCFVKFRYTFHGEIVVPIINNNVIENFFHDLDGIHLHQLTDKIKDFISKENEIVFRNALLIIYHENQAYIFRSGSGRFNIIVNYEQGRPTIVKNY